MESELEKHVHLRRKLHSPTSESLSWAQQEGQRLLIDVGDRGVLSLFAQIGSAILGRLGGHAAVDSLYDPNETNDTEGKRIPTRS